jgi:hypothetical protein
VEGWPEDEDFDQGDHERHEAHEMEAGIGRVAISVGESKRGMVPMEYTEVRRVGG